MGVCLVNVYIICGTRYTLVYFDLPFDLNGLLTFLHFRKKIEVECHLTRLGHDAVTLLPERVHGSRWDRLAISFCSAGVRHLARHLEPKMVYLKLEVEIHFEPKEMALQFQWQPPH